METQAENILDRLPHRPPFRFISDIIQINADSSGQAIWRVDGNEDFFTGHFPGYPIVPGVLIGEALAQLSGLVAAAHRNIITQPAVSDAQQLGKLAQIDIRFGESVTPPAQIHLSSRIQRTFGDLIQFDVLAKVDEVRVTHGSLTLYLPALAAKGQASST